MKLKRRKGKKDPRVMSEIVIAIALGKKPEETKNGAKKGKKKPEETKAKKAKKGKKKSEEAKAKRAKKGKKK